MRDSCGRTIDYLRLSVTDLCNYRCQYCMPPEGVEKRLHSDILSIEELAEIAAAAVRCGVKKIRLTGGEPLVRRGLPDLCRMLRAIPGLAELCLTTNGSLLPQLARPLRDAGVDRLNISLDTLRPDRFAAMTRLGTLQDVLAGIKAAEAAGFRNLKFDTVLIGGFNDDEIEDFVNLSREHPWEMRFIELMPIGEGRGLKGVSPDEALARLRAVWPDLHPTDERRGNGPAQYYAAAALEGRIGLIGAVSHAFCAACNRVRLTSTGVLKPCLCYEEGTDLRSLLRGGCTDEALARAMAGAIRGKPLAHCFAREEGVTERRAMFQIGG